jgi:CheY-like chemotaxis protein
MNRLFKAFSQAESQTTRLYGGTGLGLKISKSLTIQMGGEMWAESKVGEGSKFIFKLPFERVVTPSSKPSSTSIAGKCALVISSSWTASQVIGSQLESYQMSAKSTTNSQLFKDITSWTASRIVFDIIIVDLHMAMPATGVEEVLRGWAQSAGQTPRFLTLCMSKGTPANDVLLKPVRPDVLIRKIIQMFDTEEKRISATVLSRSPQLCRSVLIAEDNLVNQKIVKAYCQKLGVLPHIVSDGKEVLAAMAEQDYDVILMDLNMEGMGGLECAELIRKNQDPQKPRPYIIAQTAASPEIQKECRRHGMDDFLSKPFSLESLRTALSRFLP